jgi:hypothetical protein
MQLEIEHFYLDRGNHTLRYAYAKYKEFCRANTMMKKMKDALTWKGAAKLADLKGIFASTSYFYSNYEPFKFVEKYPALIDWLENTEDRLSDEETWGFSADDYNLGSLHKFLRGQGEDLKKSKDDEKVEEVQKQFSKKKGKSKAVEPSSGGRDAENIPKVGKKGQSSKAVKPKK